MPSTKVVNQTALSSTGIPMTPSTNSRIVRPRDIRAKKLPTKGAQESPQAQ